MPRFLSIGYGSWPSSEFHSHHCSEISIYTAGTGEAEIGDEIRPFRPGTIVLYPPIKPHRERSRRGFSEFWIQVDGLDLDGLPGAVQDTPQKTFERLAQLLHDEHHLGLPPAQSAAQEIFDLMMLHLRRLRSEPALHPQVARLRQLLTQNIGNSAFDLHAALADLPLSPGHLKSLFRRATGKSPHRYLLDLRIGQGKRLLRQGYSVKEAAFHVGFEDPYYFSRRFFQQEGRWPSAYKAKSPDAGA
jgi:AraC-like DNA-binding protein